MRINWSNPLTRGLVFDLPMAYASPSPRDLVSNKAGAITGTTAKIAKTTLGYAFISATNDDVIDFTTNAAQNSLSYLSIEALVKVSSAAANGARLFNKYDEATIIWLGVENETALGVNRLGFRYRWSGALGEWASANGSMTAFYDTIIHVVTTYDTTSTSNVPTFYINGIKQTTQTITGVSGTLQPDGDDLGICSRPTPNTQVTSFLGDVYYTRIYKRLLTDTDVKRLYVDPYGIYRMPQMTYADVLAAPADSGLQAYKTLLGVGF